MNLFAGEQCKKKWKTLRIQQRRLLIKKIRKKGKFRGAQWNCYDSLKFIIPHMDWTSAEERTIKKETSITDTDDDDDDEPLIETLNEDSLEELVDANVTAATANTADVFKSERTENDVINDIESSAITEQLVYNSQPTYQQVIPSSGGTGVATNVSTKNQTLSQFVLTYVPTHTSSHRATSHDESAVIDSIPISSSGGGHNCRTSYTKALDMDVAQSHAIGSAQILQQSSNPTILSSTTIPSYQVVSTIDQMLHRNTTKDSTPTLVDATHAGNLNYFLLDVAQQMSKLNDIAQMEVKIEIHKLLLAKLKDAKNLQHSIQNGN